jgi:hypothetical protein
MEKKQFLLHGWEIGYDKEDWYPPLSLVLQNITAEQAAWKDSVKKLDHAHQSIRSIITGYNERDLERKIPDSIDTWLYSLILHDAYHTGQIVQLCKMQGSWPSERSFGHS